MTLYLVIGIHTRLEGEPHTTIYGIFKSEKKARKIVDTLKKYDSDIGIISEFYQIMTCELNKPTCNYILKKDLANKYMNRHIKENRPEDLFLLGG